MLDIIHIDFEPTPATRKEMYEQISEIRWKNTSIYYCVSENRFYLITSRKHGYVGMIAFLYPIIAFLNIKEVTAPLFPSFTSVGQAHLIGIMHFVLSLLIIPALHVCYTKRILHKEETVIELDRFVHRHRIKIAQDNEREKVFLLLICTIAILALMLLKPIGSFKILGWWENITFIWLIARLRGGLWLMPILKKIEKQVWPEEKNNNPIKEGSVENANIYDS